MSQIVGHRWPGSFSGSVGGRNSWIFVGAPPIETFIVPPRGPLATMRSIADEVHPKLAILPGVAIIVTVLGFDLLGDALRDALDQLLRNVTCRLRHDSVCQSVGRHRSMRLHVLGAGTPTPSSTRFGSSFVVEVGGEYIMIDCGPAATHKMVQVGLWPTMIDHLFFTHHHFDHDVDYPCFILCRWDQGAGKERPLNVYGPKLTAQLTERILSPDVGAFAHDWIARVNAPLSQRVHVNRGGTLPRRPPAVSVRELAAGEKVSTAKWHVTTSAAVHVQPWLDSLAYRLDSAEGSIVFTGDTEPCDSVVELARGADTLVSMCWDDRDNMAASGENRGQSGIEDAADMAAASGVRRLVLVHMGRHISEAETLQPRLRDVSRLFRGEIIVSQELGVFDL